MVETNQGCLSFPERKSGVSQSATWVLWILGTTVGIAGCQQYQRRPLDLEAHTAAWKARDVSAEPVADYAHRLMGTDTKQAEQFDPSDGLSLDEAEAVALYFNPALRVARLQAKVPLVGAQESGWWDDPQLEVEILRIVNRGRGDRWNPQLPALEGVNAGGLDIRPLGINRVEGDRVAKPWVIGVGLGLTVPLSGRLEIEKQKAWAEYDTAWRQVAVQEWELLATLRARWLEWSATKERIGLTQQYLDRLDHVLGIAEKLAESGELKPTDARVFRIEQVSRQSEVRTLEAEANQQRLALMAILGLVPDAPLELEPELIVPMVDVAPEHRRDVLLAHHPRLHTARAEYEVAEQHLHLQIRKQYPDVTIGPAYEFEEGLSRLGFGLGMPIPLWNRNRQGIAEALAARDLAQAQAQVTYEVVVDQLAQAEARLASARHRRQMLQKDVAPLVDRQLTETRNLIELGEIDVLLLRDALTRSLETKLKIVDVTLAEALAANGLRSALQPRHLAEAEIEENE